jgi:SOS-response transcriptional repressor LexA
MANYLMTLKRAVEAEPKLRVGHKLPTQRQQDVLDYVRAYTKENGYGPSIDDMRRDLKFKSTSTVATHLTHLEAKGWLMRMGPRSFWIKPEDGEAKHACPHCGGAL